MALRVRSYCCFDLLFSVFDCVRPFFYPANLALNTSYIVYTNRFQLSATVHGFKKSLFAHAHRDKSTATCHMIPSTVPTCLSIFETKIKKRGSRQK